ncbi:MAG: GtrA family protein [Cytophagales bacterium]|nr:GtrA family protein [Rhizobacter sp.]
MIGRFFRYGLVGGFATAVHYAVLVLCVEVFQWPAYFGSGVGAVVGAQVAFFGNRRFTFAHDGALGPAWFKFQGTALLGALVGMVVVAASVQAGWHYLIGQVLATLTSLVLTFAVNRAWTFR